MMAARTTALFALSAAMLTAIAIGTAAAADGAARGEQAAADLEASTLVHAWNADGTPRDSVGNDTGTLLRGATYGPGPRGGSDHAFSMSGDRQQVRFNRRGGNFGRHDFTVSFDILTSAARKQAVIEKRPVCNAASFWGVRLSATGLVQPELMSDALGTDYTAGFTSTTSVADGEWHQIVMSRAGRTVSLYIDGNLEDTATTGHSVELVNDSRLRIGMSVCVGADGTRPFRGEIDDIRFYSSALTPEALP